MRKVLYLTLFQVLIINHVSLDILVSKMKLGIAGYGYAGQAMEELFKD